MINSAVKLAMKLVVSDNIAAAQVEFYASYKAAICALMDTFSISEDAATEIVNEVVNDQYKLMDKATPMSVLQEAFAAERK